MYEYNTLNEQSLTIPDTKHQTWYSMGVGWEGGGNNEPTHESHTLCLHKPHNNKNHSFIKLQDHNQQLWLTTQWEVALTHSWNVPHPLTTNSQLCKFSQLLYSKLQWSLLHLPIMLCARTLGLPCK